MINNKKILQPSDFVWKEKKANNIESNPLEYWYTTYDSGSNSRLYYIVPQYPSLNGYGINSNSEPELYIYFEAIGSKLLEGETDCKYTGIGNGYKYSGGSFKRAFRTLDEAKARAYVDYTMVYEYAYSFINKPKRSTIASSTPVNGDNVKTCKQCGVTKEFSEFFKNSKTSGGCENYCKSCSVARKRESRLKLVRERGY